MEQLTMSARGESRQTAVEQVGRFCDGFRMPANATCQRAPGPASESRQGTKPRGVGHPVDQRALWGIGWHRCRRMGPKMLHRHDEAKTGAGTDSARSSITV